MTRTFLCDQMCAQLGRWLRTAGYDTVVIKDAMPDREIFAMAQNQGRTLLTRDRDFLDLEGEIVILLGGESLDEWAAQLREAGVNWLFAPFTRCLECNSKLEKTPPRDDLPEQILQNVTEFWICPTCQKLFWLGSHTEHMMDQLQTWNRLA